MTEEEAIRAAYEHLLLVPGIEPIKIEKIWFESAEEERKFFEKTDKDLAARITFRDTWTVIFKLRPRPKDPMVAEWEKEGIPFTMDPPDDDTITVLVDDATGKAEILMEL